MKWYSSKLAARITAGSLAGLLVLALWMPHPLMLSVLLGLLAVNLTATILVHLSLSRSTLGWFLMQVGALGIVVSVLYTFHGQRGGEVALDRDTVVETVADLPLPFSVKLAVAERVDFPGTELLESYQGVLVAGSDTNLLNEIGVSLHVPFLHEGTLFAVHSASTEEKVILQAYHNPLRRMPLVCGGIVLLGLLSHLILGRKSR